MDYRPTAKPILAIPPAKKPINGEQTTSNSFSGTYTYKFITNPNQTSKINNSNISNKTQNYNPKPVTRYSTHYFRERGISERVSMNTSHCPIIKTETQNDTCSLSDTQSECNIDGAQNNNYFKKNDKKERQSIQPQNYHSLLNQVKIARIDSFTDSNLDFSTLSVESNSKKRQIYGDQKMQQNKQKSLFWSCGESTMMEKLYLQSRQKYSKLEKDYKQLVDKFSKLQSDEFNDCNKFKRQQSQTDIKQKLLEKESQLINLQNQNIKIDQSLRISRSIISNLNQKIKKIEDLHQVKIRTLEDSNKKALSEFKKKKQDEEAIVNKQILNFGATVKVLEKINFDLKIKIIDQTGRYQQKLRSLQYELKTNHQSEKTLLFEQIQRLTENKKKYLSQQKQNIQKEYQFYSIQNQKLRNCLAKAEEETLQLYSQNRKLMEENTQLNDKYTEANEQILIKNEEIQNLKKQITQMNLQMQNKQNIIVQQNVDKNNLLNEIKQQKQIVVLKQQQLEKIRQQLEKQKEAYLNLQLNANSQIYNLEQQILKQNQQFAVLSQYSDKQQDKEFIDANSIQQSIKEQQIVELTYTIRLIEEQLQKSKFQIESLLQQNMSLTSKISEMSKQIDQLKLQHSNQQQSIQPNKEQSLSKMQMEYRQSLEDQIKKLSVLYDCDLNSIEREQYQISPQKKNNKSSKSTPTSPNQIDSLNHDITDRQSRMSRQIHALKTKIQQLTFINTALNTKVDQYDEIQENTNILIMNKLKNFQTLMEKNQKGKNQLEDQIGCLKNRNLELAQKCQFLQQKNQWLETVQKIMEKHLHETTQDLLKIQAQFINFKLQTRYQKQRWIEFQKGNEQNDSKNQKINLSFQFKRKRSALSEQATSLLDQYEQHLMIKSSQLLKDQSSQYQPKVQRGSKSLLELQSQLSENNVTVESPQQSLASKNKTQPTAIFAQLNKQSNDRQNSFIKVIPEYLKTENVTIQCGQITKNEIEDNHNLQYGNIIILNEIYINNAII